MTGQSQITEDAVTEFKSLRKIILANGRYSTEGLRDLAVTCVCLANAQGGMIVIGIEDKDKQPPKEQLITDEIVNTAVTRLRTLCFNVGLTTGEIHTHSNGSQFFDILVHPSSKSIATTADGKIYIRIGDQCQAARSEDIHRLASEKDAFQWKLQLSNIVLDILPSSNFIATNFQLSQKEFIVLGIVTRHGKILATKLTKELQLSDETRLRSYVGKLLEKNILISRGIKKGTEYLVNPKLIASSKINVKPTLKVIELPRLKALIEETFAYSQNLTMQELHSRLGDVALEDVRKIVYRLAQSGILEHSSDKTYRKYWLAKKKRNEIEKQNIFT